MAPEPIPMLLVTDIGRDIDDTVAMIALSTYEAEGFFKLVGVIATGGAGEERARVTRFWLRRLGYKDEDVPVAACYAPGKPICLLPNAEPGVPSFEDAAIFRGSCKEKSAGELILQLAREHHGKLQILAIAPFSSIADALDTEENTEVIRKGVAKLYIQGQATINEDDGRLSPDFLAFNLSENKEASNTVFEKLQDHIPFQLLSKHAAYRVSMLREDFLGWDQSAGDHVMTDQARNGLTAFRKDMPNVFYRLYPVPEDKRGDNDWFKTITYVSHPFDPLLTISACHPDLFVLEPVPNKSGRGDHMIIGRLADDGVCGVPNPDKAREELSRAVTAAGARIRCSIKPEPVPVLLVTDIGRHVDDTLALLALAQYQAEERIRLAGVVTTGGKAEDRARLARFWLRKLGMRDTDVQVAACLAAGEEKDVCAFPNSDPPVPAYEEAAIYEGSCKERSAAELILNLAELYSGKLQVLVMAPMSALASSLEYDVDVETIRRGVRRLLIQGQAKVGDDGALVPDFEAYNLRQDEAASSLVFEKLQGAVEFELLSKHAAHRVELAKGDFDEWDGAATGGGVLLEQGLSGIDALRKSKPDDFARLFPSCDGKGDGEWQAGLTHISHPYNPLLAVAMLRPDLFVREKAGRMHHIIGRVKETDCGVPDPDTAHAEICRAVLGGVRITASAANTPLGEPTPVVLIADFGRNFDDIMALLTISSYAAEGAVKLAGVVSMAGKGEVRPRAVRYWLRKLGYKDAEVPVAACYAPDKETCFLPDFEPPLPSYEDAVIYKGSCKERSAAELLLNLADLHKGRLKVVAIGPLTSIAAALDTEDGADRIRQGVAKLMIQGQATVGAGGAIEPDFVAANLRQDLEASKAVFSVLQDHVPFVLMGKHAAYRVPLGVDDFAECDRAMGNNMLMDLAFNSLEDFRRDMPTSFYKVYPIPEDSRGDGQWKQAMAHISHPYGPLLSIVTVEPSLFELETVKSERGGVLHAIAGKSEEGSSGVSDPDAVRRAIHKHVGASAVRLASADAEYKAREGLMSKLGR